MRYNDRLKRMGNKKNIKLSFLHVVLFVGIFSIGTVLGIMYSNGKLHIKTAKFANFITGNEKNRRLGDKISKGGKSGDLAAVDSKNGLIADSGNNIRAPLNFDGASRKNALFISTRDKEIFDFVLGEVVNDYVREVDVRLLYEYALKGLLSSLDPHSSYLNEEEFKEMKVKSKGEFGGLGIVVTKEQGFIKVVSPIDDTPAFRAGIKTGDYISEINGELTYDMALEKAVEKMRGKPGTKVKIVILRRGESEPKNVELTREIIKVNAVKGHLEANDVIYMKITNFSENTRKELVAMWQKLNASLNGKKPTGLVLDLRNNPGGLLEQAVEVSELFLEKDKVVVSTRGRDNKFFEVYKSSAEDIMIKDIPVVVLVNEGSASASEIVAGALKDHGAAVIMGTKTFGKASVQVVMPLVNGSAVRMTVAKYYTPNEVDIQQTGIVPDIIVPEATLNYHDKSWVVTEAELANSLKNDAGDVAKNKNKDDVVSLALKKNMEKENNKDTVRDYQLSRALDTIATMNYLKEKKEDGKSIVSATTAAAATTATNTADAESAKTKNGVADENDKKTNTNTPKNGVGRKTRNK